MKNRNIIFRRDFLLKNLCEVYQARDCKNSLEITLNHKDQRYLVKDILFTGDRMEIPTILLLQKKEEIIEEKNFYNIISDLIILFGPSFKVTLQVEEDDTYYCIKWISFLDGPTTNLDIRELNYSEVQDIISEIREDALRKLKDEICFDTKI